MNEKLLLEMATDLGYRLAMAGAETYRIEESVIYVLRAYGMEAECFSIPNCLYVSIISADGTPLTRMRRIGPHGNDLDAVEKYSGLSRAYCQRKPDPEEGIKWLDHVASICRTHSIWMKGVGYFLGAFGYGIFFGGNFCDALGAGVCGLLVLAIDYWMDYLKSTTFFRTIIAACLSALMAYCMHAFGMIGNADATIIGTLMILVPGLLFTNAMRDIMYGDTNSGINRVVQVLLIAVAIALGTAAALQVTRALWGDPIGVGLIHYGPVMLNVGCFIGCIGFAIYFNIHGWGMLLCALGGVLTWSAYMVAHHLTGNVITANLAGGIVASLYAEIMARVRKYPAISYLVVSIFPLLPGAGLYYTMAYAVQGDMTSFANKGFETAAVAGTIALGILLISTMFRMWAAHLIRKKARKQ